MLLETLGMICFLVMLCIMGAAVYIVFRTQAAERKEGEDDDD